MSSEILRPIFEALGAKSQTEAAAKLDIRQSVLSDCIRKGYVTDSVYVALAKCGVDIRNLISKEPYDILKILSNILNVECDQKIIADVLGLPIEVIQNCKKYEEINVPVYAALARKGYDIRKLLTKNSHND